MKKGWETTQLSAVAAVQSGAGFPDRYQGRSDGEIPFYKVSDMNIAGNEREMVFENNSITEEARRELGAFLFPQGSTIFPKIGGAIATNKKRLTTRDCCVDNNVMGVIPKPGKIISEFLFYFFLAHDLSEFANEAHLPSIRKTVVEDWPIILPVSLAEQQRIVGLLDEAFEGLATAKTNAEKNLQNARALFESHLQSVFTQRGPGWVEKRIIEVSREFGRGKSKHRPRNEPKLYDGPYPFIQTGDISNADHWLTNFTQTYSELGLGQSRLWPKGTICIAIVGATVGETAILDFESCFPDSVIGIVVNEELADNEYVEFLLQSFKAHLKEKGKGTARDNINLGTFEDQMFPFPALKRQKQIVATLNSLREETQRLFRLYERKLAALEALKKSLLHQAFTGTL